MRQRTKTIDLNKREWLEEKIRQYRLEVELRREQLQQAEKNLKYHQAWLEEEKTGVTQ